MPFIIDTDIAIHFSNSRPDIVERLLALGEEPYLSLITRLELEGGVYAVVGEEDVRRQRTDTILSTFPVLAFTAHDIAAYGRIVASCGVLRKHRLDRMIAAQALSRGLTLISANRADFERVAARLPLDLRIWVIED